MILPSNLILYLLLGLTTTSAAWCQPFEEISLNAGWGSVFRANSAYDQNIENYLALEFQSYFANKGGLSIGLQTGGQRIVSEFRESQPSSQYSYSPSNIPLSPPSTQDTEIVSYSNYLWHLLLLSKYQFKNTILIEASAGTLVEFSGHSNILSASLIGLGMGYEFKLTNSLSIPLKAKAYRERSGMYVGVYSGIAFRPGK